MSDYKKPQALDLLIDIRDSLKAQEQFAYALSLTPETAPEALEALSQLAQGCIKKVDELTEWVENVELAD